MKKMVIINFQDANTAEDCRYCRGLQILQRTANTAEDCKYCSGLQILQAAKISSS